MSDNDAARALADLAVELAATAGEPETARAVLQRVTKHVPETDFASLTMKARRGFVTIASTDDVALTADQYQYELAEGPCVSAARSEAEWFRSGDVGADRRWPRWGPRASALGIASLLSIRMVAEQRPMGALNLYATTGGRFSDRDEVDFALLYAAHAAVALTSARQVGGLNIALESRHAIGVAQGILMERFGLDVDSSFDLLRRYSSNLNTPLTEIARFVVTTRTLPTERA